MLGLKPKRVLTAGSFAAALVLVPLPALASADITASIGCAKQGGYTFNAHASSLPANTVFDIKFSRFGSDGSSNEPYSFTSQNRVSSSNGILVSPSYSDYGTITIGDFGTEYVTAVFIRHSDKKSFGSNTGSVSQFKCEGGGSFVKRSKSSVL